MLQSSHEVKEASGKGHPMNSKVNATELEVIRTFEGYTLARHNGNLGIWSIHQAVDWEASYKLPAAAPLVYFDHMEAYLVDDDANHLLDPEFDGVFECRVLNLRAEGSYLASLEAN
jgi:hypothetical protein